MESRNPQDMSKHLQPAGDDPARWSDEPYPGDYRGQVQRAIDFAGVSHDFFLALQLPF